MTEGSKDDSAPINMANAARSRRRSLPNSSPQRRERPGPKPSPVIKDVVKNVSSDKAEDSKSLRLITKEMSRNELLKLLEKPPSLKIELEIAQSLIDLIPKLKKERVAVAEYHGIPNETDPEIKFLAMGLKAAQGDERIIILSDFVLPPVKPEHYSIGPGGHSIAFTEEGTAIINVWLEGQDDDIVFDGHIHPEKYRDRQGRAQLSPGDLNVIKEDYFLPAFRDNEELVDYVKTGFMIANVDEDEQGRTQLLFVSSGNNGVWTRKSYIDTHSEDPKIVSDPDWEFRSF